MYRIEYGKDSKRKMSRFPKGTAFLVLICVVALVAALEFTGIRQTLWNRMIPGDAQVTAAAIDGLVADIQAGQSPGNAFTAFCREILDHAVYPQ